MPKALKVPSSLRRGWVAIVAAGTTANPLIQSTTPGLAVTKRGYISANDDTLATSKPGVFAGGDIVDRWRNRDPGHGAGRKAAKSINEYLKTLEERRNRKSRRAASLVPNLHQ